MTEREAYYGLMQMIRFEPETIRKMVQEAGSAAELLSLSDQDLLDFGFFLNLEQLEELRYWREEEHIREKMTADEKKQVLFAAENDSAYPERLNVLKDPPLGLFYRGTLPDPGKRAVAVIGSRRCTGYGKEMAHYFSREFALRGVNVISGMALGADGFAGRGALAAEESSFAVLGGGVDICYPRENIDLYDALRRHHGILSERPTGYYSKPFDFPRRNRIVAGLADAVIVIEAAEKSGTMITVQQAMAQNKTVFALPGRVGDRMSMGCNRLLREGAEVLTCPEDVFQFLGLRVREDTVKKNRVTLSRREQTVFSCFESDPLSVEELLLKTAMPVSEINEILVLLEIKGLIRKENMNGYRKLL